jgi:hypothetical protein
MVSIYKMKYNHFTFDNTGHKLDLYNERLIELSIHDSKMKGSKQSSMLEYK